MASFKNRILIDPTLQMIQKNALLAAKEVTSLLDSEN
jgi:hypothetical protein